MACFLAHDAAHLYKPNGAETRPSKAKAKRKAEAMLND